MISAPSLFNMDVQLDKDTLQSSGCVPQIGSFFSLHKEITSDPTLTSCACKCYLFIFQTT